MALRTPPFVDLETELSGGRQLPVEELRERFAAAGAREHAGLGTGGLWVGSWSEYSATDLPVGTGSGVTP